MRKKERKKPGIEKNDQMNRRKLDGTSGKEEGHRGCGRRAIEEG